MATTRTKEWFLQGPQTTTWPRFRENNKPTEATFGDLFESILFKENPTDTATETTSGHVRIANKEEINGETDVDVDGVQNVVKPSFLPKVDISPSSLALILDEVSGSGINVKSYQSVAGKIEYIINALIDTGYLQFDGSNQISLSNTVQNLLTALATITSGTSIVLDIDDFPSSAFDGGGIYNNAGLFEINTDSTLEVEAITNELRVKDGGITLAKLQTLSPGDVIVGQTATGNPIVANMVANDHIIIGNGTGISVVDINTLFSTLSIPDNTITAIKIKDTALGDGLTRDASTMYIDLSTAASMEFLGGKLQFKNDSATPGNNYYYGTNAIGTKGWYNIESTADRYTKSVYVEKTSDAITGNIVITFGADVTSEDVEGGAISCRLYERSGMAGSYIWTEIINKAAVITTGALNKITQIDYTGLTVGTVHRIYCTYTVG